ncbi:MAG: sarcosine oxidase [Gammaproteobacteria bacterium]
MSASTVQPTDYKTRSFHYRTLLADGAQFSEWEGCAIASSFGGTVEEEISQAGTLGLADLTPLSRIGFKGKRAVEWLRKQGIEIGDQNNYSWKQGNGTQAARLSDNETLILEDIAGISGTSAELEQQLVSEDADGCFSVPRRNLSAWLLVTGDNADAMFAKLCGVDMRKSRFLNGSIAQTSMARMNVIAIRQDLAGLPAYHLVFDSASADYLWRMLKDAMIEYDGRPVGHEAVQALAQRG